MKNTAVLDSHAENTDHCAPSEEVLHWQSLAIGRSVRNLQNGHNSFVLWLTGISGAGKSTIADLLEKKLHLTGIRTYVLDGDNIRLGLNRDLGFTDEDRTENIRRVAEVSRLMVDAGIVVIVAMISPFRSDRKMARDLFLKGDFLEIFVDTPLCIAEQRDPKGLYRRARRGELKKFTGIDSPYEEPQSPELSVKTELISPEAAVDYLMKSLLSMELIPSELSIRD